MTPRASRGSDGRYRAALAWLPVEDWPADVEALEWCLQAGSIDVRGGDRPAASFAADTAAVIGRAPAARVHDPGPGPYPHVLAASTKLRPGVVAVWRPGSTAPTVAPLASRRTAAGLALFWPDATQDQLVAPLSDRIELDLATGRVAWTAEGWTRPERSDALLPADLDALLPADLDAD